MNNEVLKTIESRRSVRAYSADPLTDEEVDAIVNAGLYAPSAANQQSWHLTVIRTKEVIDRLNEDIKQTLRNSPEKHNQTYGTTADFHVFYNAPLVVLVSGQEGNIAPMADCSAAIQNMLLAAESLGIGSCWIAFTLMHFTDTTKNTAFGVPHTHKPMFAVAFGRPAKEKGTAPRRREATVNYL